MNERLFWECGAQFDLADLDGALYVPGAQSIRPRLGRLAAAARQRGAPRLCTIVVHREGDPDVALGKPDFKATFPMHGLEGGPGAEPIPETVCVRPLEIPRDPPPPRPLRESLRAYSAEVVVEIPGFDPWAHPALPTLFEILAPKQVVLYGVPADAMVANAVKGLLGRGVALTLVADAVKPFDAKAWGQLRDAWAEKGVAFADHQAILAG